mgnify:CR=1 FL=1
MAHRARPVDEYYDYETLTKNPTILTMIRAVKKAYRQLKAFPVKERYMLMDQTIQEAVKYQG